MSQNRNDTCAPPGPDATHFETMNAETAVMRLCDLFDVPLADLVKTVESLPRWVPAKDVPAGAETLSHYFYDGGTYGMSRNTLSAREHKRLIELDAYVLMGDRLYPKPPKVNS